MSRGKSERSAAYRRGILAEYLAIVFLGLKGYRLLGHRYRCHEGEIDVIASRGRTLVFVEVKIRQSMEGALEAVSPASRKRIARAAGRFLADPRSSRFTNHRFDVIALSPPCFIKHIENAWFAQC